MTTLRGLQAINEFCFFVDESFFFVIGHNAEEIFSAKAVFVQKLGMEKRNRVQDLDAL